MAASANGSKTTKDDSLLSEVLKQDEATMAQIERIQKEVAEGSELIGSLEDVSCLEKEYSSDDQVYQGKIDDLKSKYCYLRRTRGDGNCFFRALAFVYLEVLLNDKTDFQRFKGAVEKNKTDLLSLGYPSFTLEDFHDNFMDVLGSVDSPEASLDSLLQTFRDQGMSDYIVCYMRLLTSGYLQSHAGFYEAFLDGIDSVKSFCSTEVEPMYREADHLHISALTSSLGVAVRVQYMDRGEGGKVNHHDFPEGANPTIHLLYRPGHYDILYP